MPLGVLVHVVEPRRAGAPGLAHRCAQGRQRGQLSLRPPSTKKEMRRECLKAHTQKRNQGKRVRGGVGGIRAGGPSSLLGAEVTEK